MLFSSPDKPLDMVIEEHRTYQIDKVANFNQVAPQLFGPRLKIFGYELDKIEDSEYNGFLWSTHHVYVNSKLNLTVDIQQAPYYTDYGFSVFLFDPKRQDSKLLCNVPHEVQDREDNFLISISDKFFSQPDVICLLKGETWKAINHIRND